MKLLTNIPARKDGTVRATDAGETYVFKPDGGDCLVCEVSDRGAIARLLDTQNFEPADPADTVAAGEIWAEFFGPTDDSVPVGAVAGGEAIGEEDDDLFTEVVGDGGMLVESHTPPRPSPPKRGPGRPRATAAPR